jgi:M6 family metalloprotease-like protein
LFVDFPNANAVNSTESVFSEGMQDGIDSGAPDFDLQFEPLHKWLRMSGEHESYDWLLFDDYLRFMQEAVDLADPDFDFSEIDSVAVIADEKALSFPSILAFSPDAVISGLLPADGNQITNGVTRGPDYGHYSAEVISHEMSHTMGLPDTYEIGATNPAQHQHVGNFGIMGQIEPMDFNRSLSDRFKGNEMLAWHRWQLGWIEDSEVFCATSSTTSIKLGPLTKNLDSRMLVMPVDSSRVLVAENRAIDGYDQNLLTGGILVYSVDERIATGKGPIKVQGDYSGDWADSSVLLQPGEKITVTGYEISVTSKVGNNYFIEISTP